MAATASQTSAPTPRGDEETLYRAHHTRLLHLIDRDVSARPQVIEDACAFAWAELLARQPERTSIVGWLRIVARREAIRLAQCDRVTVLMSAIDPDGLADHGRSTSCARASAGEHGEALEALASARGAARAQAQLPGSQGRRLQLRRDRGAARRQQADGQPPARARPRSNARNARRRSVSAVRRCLRESVGSSLRRAGSPGSSHLRGRPTELPSSALGTVWPDLGSLSRFVACGSRSGRPEPC